MTRGSGRQVVELRRDLPATRGFRPPSSPFSSRKSLTDNQVVSLGGNHACRCKMQNCILTLGSSTRTGHDSFSPGGSPVKYFERGAAQEPGRPLGPGVIVDTTCLRCRIAANSGIPNLAF